LEPRKQQEFNDLQDEIAGRDTGRMKRFLVSSDSRNDPESKDKKNHRETLTFLQMLLLNDPEYAALYKETNDLLTRAEIATEQALDQAEEDLIRSREKLHDTLEHANKLADGTAVFKDENGKILTENGRLVEGMELETIVWKDTDVSYEDFLELKQSDAGAVQRIESLRHYQVDVLGCARDRMNDQDAPPSKEEMERIKQEVIELADPAVKAHLQPDMAASIEQESVSFNAVMPQF
jgi:ElaB/YqjD/DUF883 family membrane-anchored ribosome-binding protein